MYCELIEKLAPKPVFNLKWYKDEDLYSDGPIEDTIIQIIAENEPEEYTEAIARAMCWPTYYHLTHLRKNILNWYPFKEGSSVLEIGCGLGQLRAYCVTSASRLRRLSFPGVGQRQHCCAAGRGKTWRLLSEI